MPQYSYRAMSSDGKQVRGRLAAENENDLFQQLREIGLELVDCRQSAESRLNRLLAQPIKTRDVIQLCIHLENLQAAGVPLMQGLEDVRDSTENARLKDVLSTITRAVSSGTSLSQAFGQYPKIFGAVFVSLLSAGEESGNLTESFAQLVKHLKWTEAITSKVKKATRYPTMVLLAMFGLFFFMMTFVVPEIVSFLKSSTGGELPLVTQSLIATSNFMLSHGWVVLVAPIAAFILLKVLRKISEPFALHMDCLVLRLPVIGETVHKIAISRFSHFFAVMFQSGVPILQCLETAQRVVVNRCLINALEAVRKAVQSGESLSNAMRASGQFPPLALRMIRIGEDSGNLSTTLENVTDFFDTDVDETIDRLIGMAEPALTLVAGAVMAWIIMGVIGPIYDSFQGLGI